MDSRPAIDSIVEGIMRVRMAIVIDIPFSLFFLPSVSLVTSCFNLPSLSFKSFRRASTVWRLIST